MWNRKKDDEYPPKPANPPAPSPAQPTKEVPHNRCLLCLCAPMIRV